MSWFRKGLQESDIVNSIISFCVSIEILANQFPYTEKINRKCQHCGHVSVIDTGMRQKIESFIVEKNGFTKTEFNNVWKIRNRLFHGGYDSNAFNAPELHSARGVLIVSIVKGIKELLKLSVEEPPPENPSMFPFCDPILDVVYEDP